MGNIYNFFSDEITPVVKIPSYSKKDLKDWSWTDFYNYFEDKHTTSFYKRTASWKQRAKYKSIIEESYSRWGKDVFKEMIDYVFENYKDYPWEDVTIGLVCGRHYWAEEIGRAAMQQMAVNKKWAK